MIAISPRPVRRNWVSISFASTLYLYPVLDLLLAEVPTAWKAELRLGLQEALVNAAKHGNNLDPTKTVSVRFAFMSNEFLWVISDEGSGFNAPCQCHLPPSTCDSHTNHSPLPHVEQECGRGLFILYQIFDRVEWNAKGTELTLSKELSSSSRLPYVR
ncbi:ATPase [Oscillatoriales cyanobacterium USR001]|nr:ATPase [Oscillatoriales cyanobacterium USR001]